MNERDFMQKLVEWNIGVKAQWVPTTAEITLYGQTGKTRIIPGIHEHLIYECIKELEISDELYNSLSEKMKLSDPQILNQVSKTYCQYLKDIRRQLVMLQKMWSRNFAHYRANQLITHLKYDDIWYICDLNNQRIVPIELVLQMIFKKSSSYGDHRRKKQHSEIEIDPRVMHTYNIRKENAQRKEEYLANKV